MSGSDAWLDLDSNGNAPTPGLPATIALPTTIQERVALLEGCWAKLTLHQKTFLTAFRENGFNARKAARALGSEEKHRSHHNWKAASAEYNAIVQVWRAQAANDALDRDRLLARQDDIVQQLLIPKPILHQGVPTGFEEVEAAAAGRANEVLLQAAGVIKSGKDAEINVGVVINNGPPTLNIQVMPAPVEKKTEDQRVVIDAQFTEVPDESWLDA